jgi:hypothetical protein
MMDVPITGRGVPELSFAMAFAPSPAPTALPVTSDTKRRMLTRVVVTAWVAYAASIVILVVSPLFEPLVNLILWALLLVQVATDVWVVWGICRCHYRDLLSAWLPSTITLSGMYVCGTPVLVLMHWNGFARFSVWQVIWPALLSASILFAAVQYRSMRVAKGYLHGIGQDLDKVVVVG